MWKEEESVVFYLTMARWEISIMRNKWNFIFLVIMDRGRVSSFTLLWHGESSQLWETSEILFFLSLWIEEELVVLLYYGILLYYGTVRALNCEKQVKFYFSCHYGQRKSKPPDPIQSKSLFLCTSSNYDTRVLGGDYTYVSCKIHEKVEVSHAFDMTSCDCFGYLRVESEHQKMATVQPVLWAVGA